ncbi:hypothetical protein HMN09_00531900 [Mycena chlorophos]|uniref:Elongator complex protein 2 n=1 Tax=Mycena chlorophos TaxID=658473 RepID=A0A8H6T9U4_MYCCL|nr:hypothetical protein HMN09_00531900 [Mycena chlorophos]
MSTTSYICASTNRYPRAADVSDASLVAFGSSNLVAFWDTRTDRGVFEKLVGHEGAITCVRFLANDLLSTADDKGNLRCWKRTGEKWAVAAEIQAHTHAISALTSLGSSLATTSSDGCVKLWQISLDASQIEEVQTFSLRGKYALSLALSTLPQSQVELLAIGATDRNIHIWTRSADAFVPSAVLQGHEDWVKCLAFNLERDSTLILASGSQDATIRLWKIEPLAKQASSSASQSSDPLSDALLDAFEASLGELGDAEEGGRQISLKRHVLTVKNDEASSSQYSITFDALLMGHEAGVTSLCWRTTFAATDASLLSTSTDSSLILWAPSPVRTPTEETTIWISQQRFGDVGGQRLGGFVGGLWAQNGSEALAWGWSGGWRRWRCANDAWSEVAAITGHSGPVKSLDWSPDGEYLISTALDQTTRIHGPVRGADDLMSWHEISRPQVHGYDLVAVKFLDALKFISIADEKVARVFEAPGVFVDAVEKLEIATFSKEARPVAASVPPLGLSNKAVADVVVPAAGPSQTARLPFEGELAATTLWPETEKIFGHGYESISLAASNSRRYIATACKASTAEHAVVRVYDTGKWQPVGQPLAGHTLTVTRIAFSPDDRFILSVSRDRTWRLFEADGDKGFLPVASDKSHGRIIWDCAWARESNIFVTASRDKTVKIWHQAAEASQWTAAHTFKLNDAATAVDLSPLDAQNRRYLAIGLENGTVLVYAQESEQWKLHCSLESQHVGQIHRLSWRPSPKSDTLQARMELASCSEDGTLMIVQIAI